MSTVDVYITILPHKIAEHQRLLSCLNLNQNYIECE
uniref:Uncharacterized protein n=1 Tax=Arundo donax TaxID=35708 RepID=A0A0A9BKI0_ARUDO